MYEEYEILKGGYRLPPSKSFIPDTIIQDSKTGIKYRAVKISANMKEANRASRKRRIWGEIDSAAALLSFIPIAGAGLLIWSKYGEEDTFSIIDIWSKISSWVILLSIATVSLFVLSAIASALTKMYARKVKEFLKESHYWEVIPEEDLLLDDYPELKGLAFTEEEKVLYKKETMLEEVIGPELNRKAESKKNQQPISDSEYL